MVEKTIQPFDPLNIKSNPEIMQVIGSEPKRAIEIKKLVGITKSLSDSQGELVLHIKGEYDYRVKSELRDQIIKLLKKLYFNLTKTVLPTYGVKAKYLVEFTTSKKDLKKGISRIPLEMARLKHEEGKEEQLDLVTAIMMSEEFDQENYRQSMRERETAYIANCIPTMQTVKNMETEFETLMQFGRQKSNTLYAKNKEYDICLDDFQIRKVIGQGSFGKVYLVIHKCNQETFAMKSIRKDVVIDAEQLENLRLEKHIMLCVEHPFIISMEYVFQRDYRIYFLMDFIRGGELYRYLTNKKRLTEEEAKFYAAQIALALGYLHESRIIYRDLKPENILINEDGYIKLADFGLAKMLGEQIANSFCGTPEYLSPEMVSGTGHDHTLDWWTLGILIYEMIVGIPPFYNSNKHKMYKLIEEGPIRWPTLEKHGFNVSQDAQDLIKSLLTKDKMKRLGRTDDVNELFNHKWFKSIDKQKLLNKEYPPPYIPEVKDKDDTSHFDAKFLGLEVAESIISPNKVSLIEKHKEDFETF